MRLSQNVSIQLAEEEKEITHVHRMMLAAFAEYEKYDTPSSAMNEKLSVLVEAVQKGEEQAILSLLNHEPAGSVRFKHDEDAYYFSRLGVRPEARGHGIAKAMIQWLEKYAKEQGKKKIFCRVRRDTPQNVTLYKHLGFTIAKEETIINKDGNIVDIIVMEKNLYNHSYTC